MHCNETNDISDLQKAYSAAIERRETVLLTLLDRQVEIKQDMIEEARAEVAAARARIIAAREEGIALCREVYVIIKCFFDSWKAAAT